MFKLLQLAMLAAGAVAFYGLASGADLNQLFAQVSQEVLPVAKTVLTGAITWLKGAFVGA